MKTLMTRAQYMGALPRYGTPESMAHHRAYFAQFVTPEVKNLVANQIGLPRLMASRDEHLNDIPLREWDSFWGCYSLSMHIRPPASIAALLEEAGEGNSMATGACILKEAARQVIEEATA